MKLYAVYKDKKLISLAQNKDEAKQLAMTYLNLRWNNQTFKQMWYYLDCKLREVKIVIK